MLTAVAPIEAGESIDDAATAGKLALQPVAQDDLLPNYQTTTENIAGMVATTPIYAGEQIITDKFGTGAEAAKASSPLQLPTGTLAISVTLTDTARVAGFINPGSEVAVWLNGADTRRQRGVHPAVAAQGDGDRRRLDHDQHQDDHDGGG